MQLEELDEEGAIYRRAEGQQQKEASGDDI